MALLWRLLRGMPAYLWSGWGAGASLLLFIALWELGAAYYGELILPDPRTTFATLGQLLQSGQAWPQLWITARRALTANGCCRRSIPSTHPNPAPGSTRVAIILMRVVLPAPLTPSKAHTSPWPIVRETSVSA